MMSKGVDTGPYTIVWVSRLALIVRQWRLDAEGDSGTPHLGRLGPVCSLLTLACLTWARIVRTEFQKRTG